jgi:hypothetical protein
MPPRKSTASSAVSLAHPFPCPAGDGGRCAPPKPPMMVADGLLRAATDEEAATLRSRVVDQKSLSVLSGTGSEALARLVDDRSGDGDHPQPDAVVFTCSCGHIVLT